MFVMLSTPNKCSLGATNRIAQLIVVLVHSLEPTLTTVLRVGENGLREWPQWVWLASRVATWTWAN